MSDVMWYNEAKFSSYLLDGTQAVMYLLQIEYGKENNNNNKKRNQHFAHQSTLASNGIFINRDCNSCYFALSFSKTARGQNIHIAPPS